MWCSQFMNWIYFHVTTALALISRVVPFRLVSLGLYIVAQWSWHCEPFCTAHHLNWTSVWWLYLNHGEISKSPMPSWIVGKAQLSTKKNSGMFFTYEPLFLAFFGCRYGGLLHWFLGHTIKLTSYHMLLSLWWELWGSFRQLSKVLAHVNLIFLLLLIQQVVDMNLMVIWHMDRLSVRVFWADPNEIPNILAIWCIVILLVWA
jgi:hypothetical protein